MLDVTDSDGGYLFEDMPPGQYYVVFDLATTPADHMISQPSVVDPATGQSKSTDVLINGQADVSLSMGLWKPVQVGDTVWFDDNGNGVQDANEAGVADVSVTLYNSDTNEPVMDESGNPLTAVTSGGADDAGKYLFSELPLGDYYVIFDLETLPDGYMVTSQDSGSADHLDSDADPVTGQTGSTGFILSGEQDLTLDMGIVQPVEVGDRVWLDDNGNGVQDEGEEGVPNVSVMLYDAMTGHSVTDDAGNPLTSITDESGHYIFTELPPSNYYVVFDLATVPEGLVVVRPNRGDGDDSDTVDSDANPGTGKSSSTGPLNSGESDHTLDMGLYSPTDNTDENAGEGQVRIGGTVWIENNSNGQVDEGEQRLPDVTVELYDVSDPETPVAAQVTDEDGYYLFENMPEGEYFTKLVVETLPDSAIIPGLIVGGSDDLRSTTGLLEDNDQAVLLDIPVLLPGSLRGQVWLDPNGDGLQTEAGESGLADIPVRVYNEYGDLIAESVTNEMGNYAFPTLLPGLYQVEYGTPDGYSVSPFESDDSPKVYPDTEQGVVRTEVLLISAGEGVRNVDVSLYPGASIGNRVWEDLDGDGVQDEGESGLPGIAIELRTTDGEVVAETTTDEDGNYLFPDLLPGDYYLIVSQPDSRIPNPLGTPPLEAEGDREEFTTSTITLESGEINTDINLSFVEPASIGSFVWMDRDRDGLHDAEEEGVSAVTVWLYDSEGNLVATAETDEVGKFEFMVPPGEYQLQFNIPADREFTIRDNGDDSLDSDAHVDTGRTEIIVLAPGEIDHTFHAGLILSPTAVQLISLVAKESTHGVVVEWSTGAELATFGFDIYRSRDGSFENAIQVSDSMVLASGDDTQYSFVDSTAHPEQIYSYWLVEVQNNGQFYQYGPLRVLTEQQQFITFLPIIQR